MFHDDSSPWLALQVFPRHEKKVDVILQNRGYVHFLPTCHRQRKWSDRVKTIEEPLFPGYVFCRGQQTLMEIVRATPGIVRIVSFGGKPYPISDKEIEALQCIVGCGREVGSLSYLCTGLKVKVVSGPLLGVTGMIIQVKNRNRLVLSVDVVMKSIHVDIDRAEVVPLYNVPSSPGHSFKAQSLVC
jgi:transcription antitermination factor NusG